MPISVVPLLRCVLTVVLCSAGQLANAQDSAATAQPAGKVEFLLEPYLMFPNMSGTVGVGQLPDLDVDASASDIFDQLQFGIMLYAEGRTDKWAFTTDLLYMDLKQDATPGTVIASGELGVSQFCWELAGLRRVASFLEVGVGGRVNSIYADVELVRNTVQEGTSTVVDTTTSATWFDPVFIVRARKELGKWQFQFRGDVGGFGVGSDLTWQLQALVGYRLSALLQLTTGYRTLAMDYEQGTGSDRFRYDVNTFGPMLRLGFNF